MGSFADFGESALIAALILTWLSPISVILLWAFEKFSRKRLYLQKETMLGASRQSEQIELKNKALEDKFFSLLAGFQTNLVWMATTLIALALLILLYGFWSSDFSLVAVFENSQRSAPAIYRLSALWSHHEGSLLLWILVAGFMMSCALLGAKGIAPRAIIKVALVFNVLQGAFMLFMLILSNPFVRTGFMPHQGLGMNPLLQDPSMTFHPPTLYLGFVGYIVVFAQGFALSKRFALEKETVGSRGQAAFNAQHALLRWISKWSAISWVFLTFGITAGSFWAYYELGWGGWWAWDPVENAALLPWLFGTAHLHHLRGALQKTTPQQITRNLNRYQLLIPKLAFWGIGAFLMSLLGTYITRSGVIASVHGFARDDTRGLFLLIILGLSFLGAIFFWGYLFFGNPSNQSFLQGEGNMHESLGDQKGWGAEKDKILKAKIARLRAHFGGPLHGKAFWIQTQSYFMIAIAVILLLGTFYPLYAPWLTKSGLASGAMPFGDFILGAQFYNQVLAPLTMVMLFVMSYSLMHKHNPRCSENPEEIRFQESEGQQKSPGIFCILKGNLGKLNLALLVFVALLYLQGVDHLEAVFMTPLAILLIATLFESFIEKLKTGVTRYSGAMYFGHLGFAFMILGMAVDVGFGFEKNVLLKPGGQTQMAIYDVQFKNITQEQLPSFKQEQALLEVRDPTAHWQKTLKPERRYYDVQQVMTVKSAIMNDFFSQLYVVLGPASATGERLFMIAYHPLVLFIWMGGVLMGFAGVLVGVRHLRRRKCAL